MAKTKKTKTCKKGFTCGAGCISRTKTCRSNLGPDGKKLVETYADFVKRVASGQAKPEATGQSAKPPTATRGAIPTGPMNPAPTDLLGEGIVTDTPEIRAMVEARADQQQVIQDKLDRFTQAGNEIARRNLETISSKRGLFEPPDTMTGEEFESRSGRGPQISEMLAESYNQLDNSIPVEKALKQNMYAAYTDNIDPQARGQQGDFGHRQKVLLAYEGGGKELMNSKEAVAARSPEEMADFISSLTSNASIGGDSPGDRAFNRMYEAIWDNADQPQRDAMMEFSSFDNYEINMLRDPEAAPFIEKLRTHKADQTERERQAEEEAFIRAQQRESQGVDDIGGLDDLFG